MSRPQLRSGGEVADTGLEDRLVFVAGDVFGDLGAGAFGVAHFAEDSTAWAGDAFDGAERSIRIVDDVHGGHAVFVAVLGGDLAGGGEFGDDFRAGVETAFAVGEWDGVNVAGFTVRKPWRERAGDAGVGVARDVAADGVVDERRLRRRIVDRGWKIVDRR